MIEDEEMPLYHEEPELSDWLLAHEVAPEIDADELVWHRNRLALYQSSARPVFGGEDVRQMRERIALDMIRLYETTEAGAWLVRHPPGSGKTYAFSAAVKADAFAQKSVIACGPNTAEAKRMAEEAGLDYLGAKSAESCRVIKEGGNFAAVLKRHEGGGHRGKHFCKQCPYSDDCRRTPGQYRHDHQMARRDIAAGMARLAMTVHMLRYLARALPVDGEAATVVWTDEDLWPHIAQPVGGIKREEIDDWIKHASACGDWPEEIGFMTALSKHLDAARMPTEPADTAEEHTDRDGVSMLLRDYKLKQVADTIAGKMENDPTHPSERTSESGEELQISDWRPALLTRCVELVRGVCYVKVDRKDFRSVHGVRINRDILRIPRQHRLLQSDATASPDFWKPIWKGSWRGMLDGAPKRSLSVRWEPASVLSKSLLAGDDLPFRKTVAKAVTMRKRYGRVGILTHVAWLDKMTATLRGMRHSVLNLKESNDTSRPVDFVLGSFGAHDRGVNLYRDAGIESFLLAGTFRPPMTVHHEKVATLMAMGVTDLREARPGARAYPLAVDGLYLVQDQHRGLVSGDPRTTWIADHERGAHLAQAIERVRSVDRAAQGLPPIPVYLYGPEACLPLIPLPITYEA